MEYCKFENTYLALQDCLNELDQDSEIIQAPSIHQLQTWLRDDLKIMVWCEPVGKDNADFLFGTGAYLTTKPT